jgi:DNA-binding PadR family transcriptional regulator
MVWSIVGAEDSLGRPLSIRAYLVLAFLAERGEARADDIVEYFSSIGVPTGGYIYNLLTRLVKAGLVEKTRKRFYKITPEGASLIEWLKGQLCR